MRRAKWGGIGLSGALALVLSLGGCPDGGLGPGTGGVFNLAPTAVITVDLVRGVAPLRVSFSSNRSTDDGLIVERLWDFGDGTTSPEISPAHTYETTGTFTVELTLTDDDGATSSTTTTVRVTRAPIARISVNATELPTAPGRLLFNATASTDPDGTIVSYQWDFGDGSRESLAEVAHTFASSGTFNVRLTVTDNVGITGTDEVVIRVGIRQPEIEFRLPPEDAALIVVPQDSAIWVEGVFDVEPGVPRRIIAGLDRDQDLCDAKGLLLPVDSLEVSLEYVGHINFVTDIAITPDGESVVTTSLDGTARLFNPISAALVTRIDAGVEINAGNLSPDGTQIVLAQADGVASVRDLESGGILADLIGHVGAVNDAAWSSDAAQIITAGQDQRALLWGMPDGQLLAAIPHNTEVTAAAASPINVDQLVTGELNGDVSIWNRSGDLVRALEAHGGRVDDLAVSVDGAILGSAGADGTVILWDIDTGLRLITLTGHADGATAVAFSNDLSRVFTGDGAGTIRVFALETGELLVESGPCVSPVSALAASPTDDGEFLAGIAAGTGIALDTEPSNGGDLNFTQPQALRLSDVPSLGEDAVPVGEYEVFAEVRTDRSTPSRVYSGARLQVIEPLPDSFNADVPVLPLDDDEAMLALDPDLDRQIIDLGPAGADDEVVVTLLSQPGFADRFDSAEEFSVMLLDENREVFAWFQRKDGVTPVLFDRSTRLTFSRDIPNLYAVIDGGVSLHVTFQRGVGNFGPRAQRVFVDFDGAEVGVGGRPKQTIPPLDVTAFVPFFPAADGYGDAENQLLRDAIREAITDAYAAFDVAFTFSDQSGPPTAPYSTVFVGGFDPQNLSLGVSDFVDPRNATSFGSAIAYAFEIAQAITNSGVDDPVVNGDTSNAATAKWGAAIGQVAAHHIGHLLGLRHTSNAVDLMFGSLNEAPVDPTVPRALDVGTVSQSEQFDDLPALGTQDAPQQLTDTIGTP